MLCAVGVLFNYLHYPTGYGNTLVLRPLRFQYGVKCSTFRLTVNIARRSLYTQFPDGLEVLD